MNIIDAQVSKIQSEDNLSIVSFSAQQYTLKMMSLGLNTPIKEGTKVRLGVKATSIALAKNLSGMISMSNQLECTVDALQKGALVCSVKLAFNGTLLESITTLKSVNDMQIEVGDSVIALVKASELSILEVLA